MAITSPVSYFVLIGLLIVVATLLSRGTRQDAKKLNVPLESLRGLLAVSVLSCHALVSYFSFKTGKWDPPPSDFYSYAGTESVEMFFFMSAFLFWSKCLANNGVGGYGSFLAKRLRRLAPAYYVSVLLIVLVVLVRTHFRILISPLMFLGQLLRWLVFIPTPTMNGLKDVPNINASVTWTLFLEILFYLMLPVLYRIFKGYRILIGVGAALAIYAALALRGVRMSSDPHTTSPVALGVLFLDLLFGFGFGLGLLLAFVFKTCPPEWLAVLRQRRWTPIALLCLAAPMLLKVKYYDAPQFLFAIVFFCLCGGRERLLRFSFAARGVPAGNGKLQLLPDAWHCAVRAVAGIEPLGSDRLSLPSPIFGLDWRGRYRDDLPGDAAIPQRRSPIYASAICFGACGDEGRDSSRSVCCGTGVRCNSDVAKQTVLFAYDEVQVATPWLTGFLPAGLLLG